MLLDIEGWGVSECSGSPIFIFFIKENWICVMTSHHAEPNINILLTRNLLFDSYVRQWSHPLHCLWAKLNDRMRGRFRLFTCTVRLLFHGLSTLSSCGNKTGWLQTEYSFVPKWRGNQIANFWEKTLEFI